MTPRFKAQYKGTVLGWYDTLLEAEAAIEEAVEAETNEEDESIPESPYDEIDKF